MNPGIDIIVIGYHQPDDCRGFYDALMATTDETPWDAVYFSVEATHLDVAVANELWGHSCHLLTTTNVGHATACNLAVRRTAETTNHDAIFLCNADTRLPSGVIDQLYATLWSNPTYGAIGPRQVDGRGRITAAGIFGTQAAPKHRGWMQQTPAFQDLCDDVVMAAGSLYMIKRHVWEELAACPVYRQAEEALSGDLLGAMPSVKHYYSETWPSYHMVAHGYKNVYEGRVTARHDWHKASPDGGWGEIHLPADRDHFRRLCDSHGIPHD